ncbi:MAG: hypothetical protein WAM72_12185, partial [Xanthobacteraceae bacterium]
MPAAIILLDGAARAALNEGLQTMKSIGLKVCVSALAISVLLLSPAFAKCDPGSYFDQSANRCIQD